MATANTVNVEMSVSDYEYIRKLTNIRKITANEFKGIRIRVSID